MQVMPKTAANPPISIPNVDKLAPNIDAGVKLLKYIRDDYFKDDLMDPLNKTLITLAAYNAGTGTSEAMPANDCEYRFGPQRVVSQCRICGREKGRRGDSQLRGQHLQVLPGLAADERTRGRPGTG